MMVRAHVIISGMVQGVFFRSETRDETKKLHVKGWVRNLPDGRVEAVFEGEEENVKKTYRVLQAGTAGSKSYRRRHNMGELYRRV